jgi:3-isopropylmalate/(R)-2-methylmalate dehydratase small subunit
MAKVIYKFGADISTDAIYPGRYMATVLPTETPQYCFADYKELNDKLNNGEWKGGVLIADENFGCGSSREQAASTILGHQLTIIAKSVARIFMQNSVNLGLELITCPDIEAEVGDDVVIEDGKVLNKTSGKGFEIVPLPAARKAIIDAGGLVPYTRKKLVEERSK